jgi:L-aminopeptidase/D-esterase-like protein
MFDGDTIFAVATGKVRADLNVIGLLAARAVERAVIAAVKNTRSLCGFKCYADLRGGIF